MGFARVFGIGSGERERLIELAGFFILFYFTLALFESVVF